jgi:dTDP-4-amino-4,6-dideoxygalactose transaminase
MDGVDGLAGVQAVFMALGATLMLQLNIVVAADGFLVESRSIELLLVFLSVSVLGFLVYNWAPAKVFMGDAGSTFLGFAIGIIALYSILTGALPLSVWLILGAVFWIDATFTLVRRILTGKRWYLAHKSHAYQRALEIVTHIDENYENRVIRILSFAGEKHAHKRVCLIILILNIFFLLPLATLAVVFPGLGMTLVFVAWAPLIWIVFRLGAGKERTMSIIDFPAWPQYSADEMDAVRDVLNSGKVNYWTGLQGRQFERDFAAYCGVSHGIALANGSVALELALKVLDIGPGDEVIVPPRTFIATVSSVVLCGATPIFADVDRNSQNITADSISKLITPNTKAIILVHLAGWPCDMDPIMELARKNGIRVIEDCAQAHGARYKGKAVGSFGDAAAYSFCQDKIMTTGGEGGMLLLSDHDLWEKAWAYKDHGKSHDAIYRRKLDPDEIFRWVHESFGTNWRMTEMQSAIGRIQLKKLNEWVRRRNSNAQVLAERFSVIESLRTPMPNDDCYHSYYKFYTFLRPEFLKNGWTKSKVIQEVNAEGVPCFYGSCSEVYKEKAFTGTDLLPTEDLSVARELGETSLMFVVHPTLTEAEMNATADIVSKVLTEATD